MAEDILDTNSDSPSKQDVAGNEVPNGKTNHQHYAADPEAQDMVIESLRGQIQDLFSQVTQLNAKLVKSYDRVSDLEDDLHVASAQLRTSSVKISQLELERTQHLAALNTGLLVEKHHVTTELNRLMEKATEEAAQRGQAESARAAIEKDLDDLSASLFNQANTMVAEARYGQHISQRKAEEAEQALRGAEEAVSAMQQQVQALQGDKEIAERKAAEIQSLMGKGKWVNRRDSDSLAPTLRLFGSHLPYQEFLLFVAHLRHLRMSSSSPPAMPTLLPLPFLTRLSTEDSEPTVRLDLAPSLSWLSRRSVLAAIHTGQLIIEPMSSTALITESSHLSNAGISGLTHNENIPCALCGAFIFPHAPSANASPTRLPTNALIGMAHSYSGSMGSGSSWSASLFKKNSTNTTTHAISPPPIPPRSNSRTTQSSSTSIYPSQVYIFRISSTQTSSTLPSLPLLKSSAPTSASVSGTSTPSTSHQHTPALSHSSLSGGTPTQSSSTIYPLCTSGWCLARLRSTCSLWAFVRSGIVEKVWEEEVPVVPPVVPNKTPSTQVSTPDTHNSTNVSGTAEKPPVPPRKRGLWGLASAIGEKAASWSESVSDKEKMKRASPATSTETEKRETKTLPPPPPQHPQEQALSATPPPPLPRRSEGRARTPVNQPPSASPSSMPIESTTSTTPLMTTGSPIHPTFESGTGQTPTQAASEPHEDKPQIPAPEFPVKKEESMQPTTSSGPLSSSTASAAVPTPPQTPTRSQHPTSSAASPAPPIPPRAVKRLSASYARPGTPSSIPLPESRPGTPPVTAPAATPNPPSRTASPALGSSPTTGAPPPIPRRAAARAPRRPVGEGDSRPGSPAITSAAAAAPGSPMKSGDVQAQAQAVLTSASQTQLDIVKETPDEGREENKDAETVKAPEVPKVMKVAPSTGSSVSVSSDAEVFVDAEDGARTEDEKEEDEKDRSEVETVKEAKETKEVSEEATKQEKTRDASEQEKSNQQSAIPSDEADQPPSDAPVTGPPSLPPRRSEPANEMKEEVNGVKTFNDNGSEISEEGEGVYISDGTWEERTWKELTKLREEMFWARIGAVRS